MSNEITETTNPENINLRLMQAHEKTSGRVFLKGLEKEDAWDIAKDVVNYPVHIVPAYYNLNGSMHRAGGSTPTGRDKSFNLVVVDMYRNGSHEAIEPVTGQYGSMNTADLYEQMREELERANVEHTPIYVAVSGNGGRQYLRVRMDDKTGINKTPDEFVMDVTFNTSVDGTRHHTLNLSAHNTTGDTSISVYGGDYRYAARHTKTIGERTASFLPNILKMVEAWDSDIIPMMEFIYDEKFERDAAITFIDKLAEDAGVAERHREKVRELYCSDSVRTNDTSDSLYRMNITLHQYVDDELNNKPDLQERLKGEIAKQVNKRVNKLKK